MKNEHYDVLNVEGGRPVKMWTRGVPVEEEAKRQLANTARMPFIYKHMAAMPDVHLGKGSTIGSVIPTLGAIIPAAVGVDIGCGMMAAKTTLAASDLPDIASVVSATGAGQVFDIDDAQTTADAIAAVIADAGTYRAASAAAARTLTWQNEVDGLLRLAVAALERPGRS